MSTPHDLVRLTDVDVRFGNNHIIKQVSFTLHKDCITTLIGPNGAGKTTLVRVVLGLIRPSSGQIWKQDKLSVGYMPQKLHIDRTFPLTVKRFLETVNGVTLEKINSTLGSVRADHLLNHSMHDLSGGETQRVMLARALLRDPELLVLDEPVQGVDVNGQTELYELISHIRKERKCGVLMISHDLHLVMSATDHVICFNQHICCSGHPEKVSTDPSFVSMFGQQGAQSLALYSHHHNHSHDIHGDVIKDHPHSPSKSCSSSEKGACNH